MTTRTTVRSWRAMAVAGIILAGTCYVLFQDVLHGAPVTTAHVLTGVALIIATAAAHWLAPTFKARRYPLTACLLILATGAVLYIGLMSGARNAEQIVSKATRIESINAERVRILKLRDEAQAMLNKALKDVAAKCEGGVGKNCKGAERTRDVYEAAVRGRNAELAALGAAQTPNAGYRAIAEGLVRLPWWKGSDIDELQETVIILTTWLAVLLAELSVPAFLAVALGHHDVPSFSDHSQTSFSATEAAEARALLEAASMENDDADNDGPQGPEPPTGRKSRKTTARSGNVIPLFNRHPVISALESAGRRLSNEELKQAMGCSSSEASKRWREVREQLDVGWNGRYRSIGLKAWQQARA